MSMCVCNYCGIYVDSDDDCDCFITDAKGRDKVMCERCRDEYIPIDAEPPYVLTEEQP
jgi:hypothetical protein